LHPGVSCLIGNGVVLSLEALLREADALVQKGVPVYERLGFRQTGARIDRYLWRNG
ncbi:MAG: hypothetical protein HGB05_15260, partial [Chloroflexi bacterium]|nr:hypothetical protein [Chloroflexota bacterium]